MSESLCARCVTPFGERYDFHPEALEEYRQAALWYAEREPELALQFIGSVEDAIKRVVGKFS